MAAGMLPAPGTRLGPCEGFCEHEDCNQTYRMAATPCRICGERINFQRDFFQEGDWTKLVHADCRWDEVERERGLAPLGCPL